MRHAPPLTLAVVEDDADILDLITAFFRPKGYQVVPFGDARELLAALQEGQQQFDAILTDLMLPHLSGIDLTRRLRSLGVETPIILITAHRSSAKAIEAVEAGAYDFVVKPLHLPQLQVSVERALHFDRIRRENLTLKTAVALNSQPHPDGIIGKSAGLGRAIDLAKRVADSSAAVLINGETGTGKEVIAKAIHNFGSRREHPFIAINCSAIPENLLESELFGHAKGSFTGAADKKIGLFEEAGEGTLFLDEIGDLPLPLQAKLLRVLQEKSLKRVGENQNRPMRARILSATHKDLKSEVREKRFREDLFFRLNVIPINLPPLRERREDILPLAEYFLRKFAALNGKRVSGFQKSALEYLLKNAWPGNVRELENCVERAVVLCDTSALRASDLSLEPDLDGADELAESSALTETMPEAARPAAALPWMDESEPLLTLDEVTNRYLSYALERNRGAKDKTARELGIDRKTLYRRLQDIQRETEGLTQ